MGNKIAICEYISKCGLAHCPYCQGQNGYDDKQWPGRMCQWGAKTLAAEHNKTWIQILQFYYLQGDAPSEDWVPYTMRGTVTVTLGGHDFDLPVKGRVELREDG